LIIDFLLCCFTFIPSAESVLNGTGQDTGNYSLKIIKTQGYCPVSSYGYRCHTHKKTQTAKTQAIAKPHQRLALKKASQNIWIKAEPSRETKSLSPRVVSNLRIPILGAPPGLLISQIVMATSRQKIIIKKVAVGLVQAIQLRFIVCSLP
jgi:hypothetical protein